MRALALHGFAFSPCKAKGCIIVEISVAERAKLGRPLASNSMVQLAHKLQTGLGRGPRERRRTSTHNVNKQVHADAYMQARSCKAWTLHVWSRQRHLPYLVLMQHWEESPKCGITKTFDIWMGAYDMGLQNLLDGQALMQL